MLALHVFRAPMVFYMSIEAHFCQEGLLTLLLPTHATADELPVIKLMADVVLGPVDALEILACPCWTEQTPPDSMSSLSWGLHLERLEEGTEYGFPHLTKPEIGLTLRYGTLW